MPFILRIKTIKVLTPGVPVLGPELRTKKMQIFAPPTNTGLVYYGSRGLTAGVRRALSPGASDVHEVPQNGELDLASLRFDAANANDQVNLLYYQWQDAPDPAIVFPTEVTGLAAWWKADAITGLAENAPVSSWLDSSGNNKPLVSTLANRPLYKTNVQAGMPGVLFDGQDDVLSVAMNYNYSTVIWASSLTKGGQLLWSESDDGDELIGAGDGSFVRAKRGATTSLFREFAPNWMNGVGVFAVSIAPTAAGCFVRRGGLNVSGVGTQINADTYYSMMNRMNYIGSADSDNPMGGYLLEMLFFHTFLAEPAIAGLEAYLSDKWGI